MLGFFRNVCHIQHLSLISPSLLLIIDRNLQDAKPCLYYMRTGICKYGQACKYHHPQPATNGNVLPVPVYGAGGSAVVPSSGAQSGGELSSAALSKGAYVSSSVFQLPQSYMPVIMPSPGWNTYMVCSYCLRSLTY